MKKTILLSSVLFLSGCVTFGPDMDNPVVLSEPTMSSTKVSLYCPECNQDEVSRYFNIGNTNSRYQMKISHQPHSQRKKS